MTRADPAGMLGGDVARRPGCRPARRARSSPLGVDVDTLHRVARARRSSCGRLLGVEHDQRVGVVAPVAGGVEAARRVRQRQVLRAEVAAPGCSVVRRVRGSAAQSRDLRSAGCREFSWICTLLQPAALKLGQRGHPQVDPAGRIGLVLDDRPVVGLVEVAPQVQGRVGQLQRAAAAGPLPKPKPGSDRVGSATPSTMVLTSGRHGQIGRPPARPPASRRRSRRPSRGTGRGSSGPWCSDRRRPGSPGSRAAISRKLNTPGVGAQARARAPGTASPAGRCAQAGRCDAADQQVGHDHDQPDDRDEDQRDAVVGLHRRGLGAHVLDARRPTGRHSAAYQGAPRLGRARR